MQYTNKFVAAKSNLLKFPGQATCASVIRMSKQMRSYLRLLHQYPSSLDPEAAYAGLNHTSISEILLSYDHETILQTGYILFAVWVVYDPLVFLTEDEYTGQLVWNLQEVIEEPAIYDSSKQFIPRGTACYSPDRVECLTLSQLILSKTEVQISDTLRFLWW